LGGRNRRKAERGRNGSFFERQKGTKRGKGRKGESKNQKGEVPVCSARHGSGNARIPHNIKKGETVFSARGGRTLTIKEVAASIFLGPLEDRDGCKISGVDLPDTASKVTSWAGFVGEQGAKRRRFNSKTEAGHS
jgi:hypothetical protein